MEINCTHCNGSFVLPDDRVPEAKKFKLNCPKCREPIIVDQGKEQSKGIEPEQFPHDATVAFLFIRNGMLAQRIKNFLKTKNIFVSEAVTINEAMDKVRINYYNILILEDVDLSKSILDVVKQWNGFRRREVNIILVNTNSPSLQSQEAFLRGVNCVLGSADNEKIEEVLALALGEYEGYKEPWRFAAESLLRKG